MKTDDLADEPNVIVGIRFNNNIFKNKEAIMKKYVCDVCGYV